MTQIDHGAPQAVGAGHGFGSIAIAVTAALAAALSAFVAALFLLPPTQVFPVTALGLVVAALAMALIAWAAPSEVGRTRVLYWDVAGALTVLGLCAALFGEPEQAVALLQRDDV